MSSLPLTGFTDIVLSRALAGLCCSALLAGLGATIIKVESLGGDSARHYVEACETEQSRALGMVQQVKRSDGSSLPLVRGPINIDGAPAPSGSPPPLFGEHSRLVLGELGMSEAEINDLEDRRIVAADDDQPQHRAYADER